MSGELGDGTTINRSTPVPISDVTNTVWTAVSAGSNHTCALSNAGKISCWGNNDWGQLGDGTTTTRNTPVSISDDGLTKWVAVSAGYAHTCALNEAGKIFCWGDNLSYGDLGNGTGMSSYVPVAISDDGHTKWTAVSAGVSISCALTDAGKVFCWGADGDGELGNGTNTKMSAIPVALQNGGNVKWTAVSAFWEHACALSDAGLISCWGRNSEGQFGDGTETSSNIPVAVHSVTTITNMASLPAATKWTSVTPGAMCTCALSESGKMYCWGDNDFGKLGNGTNRNGTLVPTIISDGGNKTWVSVTAGFHHSCALSNDGHIYCWGENTFGEVGNGTTTEVDAPVLIQ